MPLLYTYNAMKKPPKADYLLQVTSYTRNKDWVDRNIGIWCPQLAPSEELTNQVNEWKKQKRLKQNWGLFVKKYLEEQKKNPAQLEQVYKWLEEGKTLALGCFCEKPCECVRSLLVELILQKNPKTAVELK